MKIVVSRSAETFASTGEPDSDVPVERHLALDRDDRADARAAQALDRFADLLRHLALLHLSEQPGEPRLAEMRQRGAQLGREHDEQRDRAVLEHEAEQVA